jgi:hypothetical protein
VSIYHVIGFVTKKLAQEYSFAVYSSTRQPIISLSSSLTHHLDLSRNFAGSSAQQNPIFYKLLHGMSDSNLIATNHALLSHNIASTSLPRSGSLNNLSFGNYSRGGAGESESKGSAPPLPPLPPPSARRSQSTIDLTLATTASAATQLLLPSPLTRQTKLPTPPSSSPPSSSASSFTLRNGYEIAQTCRFNAQLTQLLKLSALFHIWTMLAVCFEMLSIAGMEYQPPSSSTPPSPPGEALVISDSDPLEPNKKIESCRRMVISGLSYDWSKHALGRPLLRKIYRSLANLGDLQTLATITCTLGGARATAYYLDEAQLYTSQSLDRMLLRYADILHRWQCHVEATEVPAFSLSLSVSLYL